MHTKFWLAILKGREGKGQLGRPRRRWEDYIRMYFSKTGGKLWTGCMWLRIGTSGGLL
jgi:hypothetical protein